MSIMAHSHSSIPEYHRPILEVAAQPTPHSTEAAQATGAIALQPIIIQEQVVVQPTTDQLSQHYEHPIDTAYRMGIGKKRRLPRMPMKDIIITRVGLEAIAADPMPLPSVGELSTPYVNPIDIEYYKRTGGSPKPMHLRPV